jgi:hypothetical protein
MAGHPGYDRLTSSLEEVRMQDWDSKSLDEIGDEPTAEEQRRRSAEIISGATSGLEAGPNKQMGGAGAGSEIGGEEVWE